MISQTGPRVVRSNSCKGPTHPGKGLKKSQKVKRKFWGQQVLFGTKFMKFGPKRANLATVMRMPPGERSTSSRCLPSWLSPDLKKKYANSDVLTMKMIRTIQ